MSLRPLRKPSPLPKVRKPLRSKPKPVDPKLAEQVFERANWTCEWCGVPGGRLDPHHVLRRSQGGPDSLDNLKATHRTCHRYVHEHVNEAVRRGFLIRTGSNP